MVLDTTRDVAHKGLLAALGAVTLAEDELDHLIDRLAARGEEVARSRFGHVESELRSRLTGVEKTMRDGLHDGHVLRQALREELERRGRWIAEVLNLPTRDSVGHLREQVERLYAEIEQIALQRAAEPPAPVPGYEDLNAREAAAKVSTLDTATLEAIRSYEQTHRNRITVLRAIDAALTEHA